MVKETKLQTKNFLLLLGVVLLILIGIFRNQINTLFNVLYGVTIDKAIHLTQPQKESFNLLLMGIGGGKHDGPNLTDTIILTNINIKTKKVSMFSIPRDLWIPDEHDKINAIYAYAQKNNTGLDAAKEAILTVTGQSVDYIVVLDFEGFIKMVDYLGGIDVNVERTFQDYEYPISGEEENTCGKNEEELKALATASSQLEAFPCRYKTISFTKGITTMNGQTALEYVRSRHGNNGEGSDFARSRRQEIVISALKDKAFSLGVILNPVKLVGIYNILKANINTNINTDKIDDFIKLAQKLKEGQIKSYVIDQGNQTEKRFGLLINPPITEEFAFKWVLLPRVGNGNFTEIRQYVSCSILSQDCFVGEKGIVIPTITPSPNATGATGNPTRH
jgi:LCP family protein required for cell wall assembly